MSSWDAEDLVLLGRAASDLTALAATIEVLRRRDPLDPAGERAQVLVARLQVTLTELVELLRQ